MGIRFERGNHKATNGPMFFFSILNDEVFEEEIRSAYLNGLSFYAYRYPGDSMFSYGSAEGFLEGLGEKGFVIGMFSPDNPIITIPYREIKTKNVSGSLYNFPEKSVTKEEYCKEVKEIIKNLREGKGEKVVSARIEIREGEFDLAEKFYELGRKFPSAFIFCFSTPATGCWIGASPELLLKGVDDKIYTMALAGTRTAEGERPWDIKNIEEQKMVTDYITTVFERHHLDPIIGETHTISTGNLEHICTPVSAEERGLDSLKLEEILKDLSPTPALCGLPKEFAMKLIKRLESFDRGCYGGFCGPFHSVKDFTFHVTLRCASITEKRICIYSGGGITSKSEPESEWEETQIKIKNTFG